MQADKIISFYNEKNGTGKTTLAYNLSRQIGCSFIELVPKYIEDDLNTDGFIQPTIEDYPEVLICDINTTDYSEIKNMLSKSDYILIPTELDYKVLIDTKEAIKNASTINSEAKIIVIFNKLYTNKRQAELPYTKYARDYLEKNLKELKIPIEFVYIRENKLWYKEFMNNKFYLDHLIKDEAFDYFKELTFFDEYFTNNNKLEILYQYSYYYTLLYKIKNNEYKNDGESFVKDYETAKDKVKEYQDIIDKVKDSLTEDDLESSLLSLIIKKFKANKRAKATYKKKEIDVSHKRPKGKDPSKLDYYLNDKIKEIIPKSIKNKKISIEYIPYENFITIIEEFEQLNKDMISFNEDLFDLVQMSEIKIDTFSNVSMEALVVNNDLNKRAYKDNIKLTRKLLSLTPDTTIDDLQSLKENNIFNKDYIKLNDLRESMLYAFVRQLFNFQESDNNRKILRDMRNLLISIDEYY